MAANQPQQVHRGRRAGQLVQAARLRRMAVDRTYGPEKPTVGGTVECGDGELLAYLRLQATGRVRSVQLETGLYQKGAAWMRAQEPGVTETRVYNSLCHAVPLVMKETPGDHAMARHMASSAFYQSLCRANQQAKGQFDIRAGLGKRIGLAGLLGLATSAAAVYTGAKACHAAMRVVEQGVTALNNVAAVGQVASLVNSFSEGIGAGRSMRGLSRSVVPVLRRGKVVVACAAAAGVAVACTYAAWRVVNWWTSTTREMPVR